MLLWVILIGLLSLIKSSVGYAVDFDVTTNGYENIVVSIHPDVPDTFGPEIIRNIEVLISDGSQRLFEGLNFQIFCQNTEIAEFQYQFLTKIP